FSRRRHMIVDDQCAKDSGWTFFSRFQIGLLTNEILRLHLGTGEARFDWIVFSLEFVSVKPVSLFQTSGGAIDTNRNWHNAVLLTGLPNNIPQQLPVFHGSIQFPSQLTYVGNAQSPYRNWADLNLPGGAKRKSLVGYIVAGDRLEKQAGTRS